MTFYFLHFTVLFNPKIFILHKQVVPFKVGLLFQHLSVGTKEFYERPQ